MAESVVQVRFPPVADVLLPAASCTPIASGPSFRSSLDFVVHPSITVVMSGRRSRPLDAFIARCRSTLVTVPSVCPNQLWPVRRARSLTEWSDQPAILCLGLAVAVACQLLHLFAIQDDDATAIGADQPRAF